MRRYVTRDYGSRDYDRGYRGRSGYSRNDNRGYDRGDSNRDYGDRGFFDKAGDEVRSWFGDDEAERRRRYDERYDDDDRDYGDRDYGSRTFGSRAYGRSPSLRSGRDFDRDYGRRARSYYGRGGYSQGSGRDYDRDDYDSYDHSGYDRDYSRSGYGRGYRDQDDRQMESRQTESYAGRGPKGYQRSSERTVEDVSERLMWNADLDPSEIEVSAENGEVTLEGTVESRRAKRMAEDLAESATGVRDVHNRLRIQRPDSDDDSSSGTKSSGTGATKSKKSS